jgi:hypothetical protein
VNLAEIRYTIARKHNRATTDKYLDWLTDLGIEPVDVDGAWMAASEYVLNYNPALGDSFALATAEHVEAALLIGGDGDDDEITDVPIKRFRDGSA